MKITKNIENCCINVSLCPQCHYFILIERGHLHSFFSYIKKKKVWENKISFLKQNFQCSIRAAVKLLKVGSTKLVLGSSKLCWGKRVHTRGRDEIPLDPPPAHGAGNKRLAGPETDVQTCKGPGSISSPISVLYN